MNALLMLAALWARLSTLAPHEATVLAAHVHGLQRYETEALRIVKTESRGPQNLDAGQANVERRTIYTRTRVEMTDTTVPQPSDVLFDPSGAAWQTYSDGRWDEARGFAVVLTRRGGRGLPPWT